MIKLLKKTPQKLKVPRGPFKGAYVFLNPANSKRKLFGLYEHVLNSWIKEVGSKKDFAIDVGANTGYDTYGLAHLLSHNNSRSTEIVAIEPEASKFPELLEPRNWPCYSNCKIDIFEKFVGSETSSDTITLDSIINDYKHFSKKKGIIKIDVEGAEFDVLSGASSLLQNIDHDWLIEIHGRELIIPICNFFIKVNRPFLIRELTPLPFLGLEKRSIETFWLTTMPVNKDNR